MPRRLMWKEFLGETAPPVVVHHSRMKSSYTAHDHEFFEIVFIVGGRGWHRSVYGKELLGPGDVFVLQPGTWHEYFECRAVEYYDIYFKGGLLKRELVWVREDPALNALFWGGPLSQDQRGIVALHLDQPELDACRRQLDALCALTEGNASHRRAAQFGHLMLLLDQLAQHVKLPQRAKRQPRPIHAAVWRGIELLQEDLARAWSLTDLAQKVHIAPEYLVRLFKNTTGLPPLAYLARCRAERAAAMLLRTGLPAGEIGAQVGWIEASHFARRFKMHFGSSPCEYREKHRRAAGLGIK
jgi:AraC family transcriptional regulator, L-rhamnose operon transcriptional activator RhaR